MSSGSEQDILDTPAAGPRIIHGGVLRVAGYVAGSGLAVVSAAVLTRHLGPSDFGRYAAVFALMTIITGITDAGTANIGIREHSLLAKDAGWRFLRHLMGIRMAITVAGAAVAVVFSMAAGYDSGMVAGTAAAGVGLLLLTIGGTLTIPLQSSLRLGWVTSLDLLRQVATVIGLVALAAAGAGIVPLLAVPIPVGLLLIVVTSVVIERQPGALPLIDRGEWIRILRLTLPFAAATLAGVLYAHVSVVGLSIAGTERETGLFAAAFRVYYVLAAVPALLVSTAFPLLARAARDDRDRLAYALRRLFEVCLIVGTGIALVTAAAAPLAIEIVAGPQYADAVSALQLLSVALLGSFLIAVGGFALLSLERYRGLLWANVAGLVLSTTLTVALAPELGEMAGSIAVVAGDLTLGAAYVLILRRGPDGVRLGGVVVLKVAAATALGLLPLLLDAGSPLVRALASGALFALVIAALRAVPDELIEATKALRDGGR